jgi:hypothetical protein
MFKGNIVDKKPMTLEPRALATPGLRVDEYPVKYRLGSMARSFLK